MSERKLTCIVFALLSIMTFIVFKDYLLLKKIFLFHDIRSDGFYATYPLAFNITNYIHTIGLPKWSFKVGMGQSIFPNMLRDPFDIIYYIFGEENISALIAYKEAIKAIVTGMVIYRYLKVVNLSNKVCIIGSFSFAFCGYLMCTNPWTVFRFEALGFAVLLLAFELLYLKNKWYLFPFAVFLTCICMPFDLALYVEFLLVYSLFRHLEAGKFNGKKLIGLYLKMMGLGFIGMLLSAPLLIQTLLQMLDSPRGSGSTSLWQRYGSIPISTISDDTQLGTAILHAISNNILGTADYFKGWDTVLGAPTFYCGLLCILLLPQLFVFVNKRTRIIFIFFILAWVLPVVFPFFRRGFWLFIGDYYRIFALFVTFMILYCGLRAMDHIFLKRKINVPLLIYTFLILIICIYNPFFIDRNAIDKSVRTVVTGFLILHTILILLMTRFPKASWLGIALLIVAFFEISCSAEFTANNPCCHMSLEFLKEKVVFNDYSYDAVKYIQQHDKSFYRIDKNFNPESARWAGLNYSQKQGYNSTGSYSSFNQFHYIRYLQQMGVVNKDDEQESRYAIGLLYNPILQTENNVKYLLGAKNFHPEWDAMWDSIARTGDITIFRNKYVLPFGFTNNMYVKESDFIKASFIQKQFITMQAFVIDDKETSKMVGMSEFQMKDTATRLLDFNTFLSLRQSFSTDSLTITHFTENYISGNINVSNNKLIYLSIPFDKGWHLKIDGIETEIIILNGGMTGAFLSKGSHTLEMSFKLQYWTLSWIICLFGIVVYAIIWYYSRRSSDSVNNPININ